MNSIIGFSKRGPMHLKKLLLTIVCATLISINSHAKNLMIDLKQVGTIEWVKGLMDQYPELNWLLDEKVAATQEGKAQAHPTSWSYQLKQKQYPEFDRTILSLVNLNLIADGSQEAYDRFTKIQDPKDRLTWEQFQELHALANKVIKDDPKTFKALAINLLLGDMGKTPHARELAKVYGIYEPDHDVFLELCLKKCPKIFPTYGTLPIKYKMLLQRINGQVHFGHVTHLEGTPDKMLGKIKKSGIMNERGQPFDFEVLTHLCDVSAALAHVNNQGSLVLTNNVYRTLMAVKATIDELAKKSPDQALKTYINTRAQWVELPTNDDKDVVLVRLACMLRLYDPQSGALLKASWDKLPKEKQDFIIQNFNPLKEYEGKTPTYVPATLINIYNEHSDKGKALDVILTKALPLVIKIIQDPSYRTYNMTYNFNKVAGAVKGNLEILNDPKYMIDKAGYVILMNETAQK
jgi:hypothetical protein